MPFQYCILHFFLLSFLVTLLLAPTVITTSGSCVVKQLPLFVLKNARRIGLFAKSKLLVTSNIEKPRESSISGSCPDRSNNNSLNFGLFILDIQTWYASPVGVSLLFFTTIIIMRLLVFSLI